MPNGDHHTYTSYELGDAQIEAGRQAALAVLSATLGAAAQRLTRGGDGRRRVDAIVALAAWEGIEDELLIALDRRRTERIERHRQIMRRLSSGP